MTAARKWVSGLSPGQQDCRRKFVCPEESSCYSGMLEQMVFGPLRGATGSRIVEFGAGNGAPVVSAILNSDFPGVVDGFEINLAAVSEARALIERQNVARQYVIHDVSFFDALPVAADYLIANPPYLPGERAEVLTLPGLWGGIDGIDVSKRLLSCGYRNVFLLVSSYSNPAALVDHAGRCGYKVSDFQVAKMSFGVYSRQNYVQRCIRHRRAIGTAFYSDHCYLVGGVLFTQDGEAEDLSAEFLACLTSIASA